MSDRFDTIEIRAARTMEEVDFWFKHQSRIPAARMEIAPVGFLPKVRRMIDAITLRGGLR